MQIHAHDNIKIPQDSAGASLPSNLVCWVISDGHAATERRSVALAHALGIRVEIKHSVLRAPWRWFKGLVKYFAKYPFMHEAHGSLTPPWPDIVIASGRQTLSTVFFLKAMNPKTFFIQINDPYVSPSHFDVVVGSEHEKLDGTNIVTALGMLNPYKYEDVAAAAAAQSERLIGYNKPFVAAFIGGSNEAYKFSRADITHIIDRLQYLLNTTEVSLVMFTNNRTSPEFIAEAQNSFVGYSKRVWMWHGKDSYTGAENPFLALIGLADHFLVTADSMSMISEVAMTGKPIHILDLAGGNARYNNFHAAFRERGIARPFEGRLAEWTYQPIYEIQQIATKIADIFRGKHV